MKKIAIVSNPTPGNLKTIKITDEIVNVLSVKGIQFLNFSADWPEAFPDFTEVWIVGGDGTLNYFINRYPQIKLPLAIFNGGSGNDFHWMMYGDITIQQQIEKILISEPVSIDAGICNNQLFLNGVGIGFDGAIVKDMIGKKKLAGKASYLLSILKNILKYKETYVSININGEVINKDCFLISVANGIRYGGGFKVAPKASLFDGFLDLNIIGKIAPLKRIKYLPVIEDGMHLNLPFVDYRQAESVIIEAAENLPCHIDGEYYESKYFEIKCLPSHFSFLR